MQIGYVKKREIAVRDGEKSKKVSFYEMMIKPLFGASIKFTLSKSKSDNEKAPDFVVYAHNEKGWINRKMKAGALWLKEYAGESFMSGHIETPMVEGGKLNISLWRAKPLYDGEVVDWEYDVNWKPFKEKKHDDQEQSGDYTGGKDIDVDEDEIPF